MDSFQFRKLLSAPAVGGIHRGQRGRWNFRERRAG